MTTEHETDAAFLRQIRHEVLISGDWPRFRRDVLQRLINLAEQRPQTAPAEDVERVAYALWLLEPGRSAEQWRPAKDRNAASVKVAFEQARAAIAAHAADHWCACDIPIQAADDTSLCDRCRRKLIARVPAADRRSGLLEAADIAESMVIERPEGADWGLMDEIERRAFRDDQDQSRRSCNAIAAAIRERAAAPPRDGTHILGLLEWPVEKPFVKEWREIWFSHEASLFGMPCWEAAHGKKYGLNVLKAWHPLPPAPQVRHD